MTEKEALKLIAQGGPQELVAWVDTNVEDEKRLKRILRRGYVTRFQDGFEYRGAVIWAQREVARRALQDG
jgi:hypothetical protein